MNYTKDYTQLCVPEPKYIPESVCVNLVGL